MPTLPVKASIMKKPRFKNALSALCLVAAGIGLVTVMATPAPAQYYPGGPLDWRRTLFAPFGQTTLHFEAPLGMCFLDQTDPVEAGAIDIIREELKAKSKQTLVAVFADCMQIAGIGKVNAAGESSGMTDVGLVTWLNEKGERAGMDRETYLDAREMTMQNYTRAGLAGYLNPMIDTEGRRTPDGVSLGFTAETEISYQKYKTVGVTGATLIRGFPIDFMMTHTAKRPTKEKQELYDLMDKFLAQQVALNAVE